MGARGALSITCSCCSVPRAVLGAAQQEGGGETKIGDLAGILLKWGRSV